MPLVTEKWVVSPYLHTVPVEMVDSVLEQFQAHVERIDKTAFDPKEGLSVLFDFSCDTCLLVSRRVESNLSNRLGEPYSSGELETITGCAIADLHRGGLAYPADEVYGVHRFESLEIEVNAHCNLRCVFCPTRRSPKLEEVMPMDLFRLVLERATAYGISKVSLNHYSEPFLDPMLMERLKLTRAAGLQVWLFSNGTVAMKRQLQEIAELGNVVLSLNIPSAYPAQYSRITGRELLSYAARTARQAVALSIETEIIVNAPRRARVGIAEQYGSVFPELRGRIRIAKPDDRAAAVVNPEYFLPQRHEGRLGGCFMFVKDLNIGIDGSAFLCAQDFEKDFVLGDVRVQTIQEITGSPRFRQIKAWVFGGESAPKDFICRRCAWNAELRRKGGHFSVGRRTEIHKNLDRIKRALRSGRLFDMRAGSCTDRETRRRGDTA